MKETKTIRIVFLMLVLSTISLIGHTTAKTTTTHQGIEMNETASLLVSVPAPPTTLCGLKGDVNNDGMINFGDINPMSYAISHCWFQFYIHYPHGNYWNADINNDHKVDGKDVNPFVSLLSI